MKKILFVSLVFLSTLSAYSQAEKNSTPLTEISETDKGPVYTIVEVMPVYVGGESAWQQYLAENLKYPAEAAQKNIQGSVLVTFIVEDDGSISNVKLVTGIERNCDEEAIRVVKMMPPWIPGKANGKPVRVKLVKTVLFNIASNGK